MTAIWEDILKKSLRCVDEVYPEVNGVTLGVFPVADFLLEAATWVARVVPTRALGLGRELPVDGLTPHADGSGSLPLPEDFLRLVSFRMKGWKKPVTTPIYDTDARYAQQSNPTLRGGVTFPVVAICDGETRMEYYSSPLGIYAEVERASYFPKPNTEEDFPASLAYAVAWKCAELTLSSMNDTAATLAAERVAEQIKTL